MPDWIPEHEGDVDPATQHIWNTPERQAKKREVGRREHIEIGCLRYDPEEDCLFIDVSSPRYTAASEIVLPLGYLVDLGVIEAIEEEGP